MVEIIHGHRFLEGLKWASFQRKQLGPRGGTVAVIPVVIVTCIKPLLGIQAWRIPVTINIPIAFIIILPPLFFFFWPGKQPSFVISFFYFCLWKTSSSLHVLALGNCPSEVNVKTWVVCICDWRLLIIYHKNELSQISWFVCCGGYVMKYERMGLVDVKEVAMCHC